MAGVEAGRAGLGATAGIRTRSRYRDSLGRRAVDVVLALVGLVLLLPVLLLVALAVRLESPGPVLFRQVRVGRGGHGFEILKFRSMMVTAPGAGPQVSGIEDPRVTRLGRLLRSARLDELPQLVNVLRGDMTVFGPRPEVPRYVAHYTAGERALLLVRPGLLGAGQLLFAREQAGQLDAAADPEAAYLEHQLHPKLTLDLAYLDERGLGGDLRLAWATATYLLGLARTP
jgi:lipopolysaccharide/colanic/teichoic acid biosynthesis glycosyltransferase